MMSCGFKMRVVALVVGIGVLPGLGCRVVPVHQQRLVSMPGMLFSDSMVFSSASAVLNQIETGAAVAGGAQAAGCTSCR